MIADFLHWRQHHANLLIGGQDEPGAVDVLRAECGVFIAPSEVCREANRPERSWVELNGTSGVEWLIEVQRPARYRLYAVVRADLGTDALLSLDGSARSRVTCTGPGWTRVEFAGGLWLTAREHVLTIDLENHRGSGDAGTLEPGWAIAALGARRDLELPPRRGTRGRRPTPN